MVTQVTDICTSAGINELKPNGLRVSVKILTNINSLKLGIAYMHQWNWMQVVSQACRLFGPNPLPRPIMAFSQLHPKENFNEISIEYVDFFFKEMPLKMLSILPGLNVLNGFYDL